MWRFSWFLYGAAVIATMTGWSSVGAAQRGQQAGFLLAVAALLTAISGIRIERRADPADGSPEEAGTGSLDK